MKSEELNNPLTLLQDLSLPRTMVQRLAKGVLPPNTQIQKDALLAMSKGATVFVNYLTNTYVHSSIKNTPNLVYAQDMHHLTPTVLMPVQIQRERRARRKEDNTAPRRARRRKGTRIRGLPASSGSRVAKYVHHAPRQSSQQGTHASQNTTRYNARSATPTVKKSAKQQRRRRTQTPPTPRRTL
jgi:histone H3/H4